MKNVSVIYLITLKLGTDLFAMTMFVELGAARLSPTVACWMCMKLQTSCLWAYTNTALYLTRRCQGICSYGLRKTSHIRNFPTSPLTIICFNLEPNYDY